MSAPHALSEDHPRIVVTFAEDSFEYVKEHPSRAIAAAFAAGVQEGSSYYGSGASAWVLPDDLEEIQEAIKDDYVSEAEWSYVKKRLPAWALPLAGEGEGT